MLLKQLNIHYYKKDLTIKYFLKKAKVGFIYHFWELGRLLQSTRNPTAQLLNKSHNTWASHISWGLEYMLVVWNVVNTVTGLTQSFRNFRGLLGFPVFRPSPKKPMWSGRPDWLAHTFTNLHEAMLLPQSKINNGKIFEMFGEDNVANLKTVTHYRLKVYPVTIF